MIVVASIVLVISMGWRFNGYLNQAAAGTLTQDVLFLILAYRLPEFLELILPISFFLALMLAYGRLHVDSEMIVLASCGMGPGKLMWITLLLSLVVMLINGIVSLWLKPAGEAMLEALFAEQRNLTEFDTLGSGRFQSIRSGQRVTYVESLSDQGRLSQIFINEIKGARTSGIQTAMTLEASSGNTVVDANGNRFLVLKNGTRYTGKPGGGDFQVIEYTEYGQLLQKEKSPDRRQKRKAIATADLLDSGTVENWSELQWRISVILMVPLLAIMAIPFSRVNPRQGRFTRLVPGIILCFLYIIGLSTARSAIEKGHIPVGIGLWWIHGMFLLVILCLYKMEQIFSHLGFSRKRRLALQASENIKT